MAKKKELHPHRKLRITIFVTLIAVILLGTIGYFMYDASTKDYIMVFNGKKVGIAEYRMSLLEQQSSFESQLGGSGNPEIWAYEFEPGVTMEDQAKERAFESMLYAKIINAKAAEMNLPETDEVKTAAKEVAKATKDYYGAEILQFIGMTDSKLNKLMLESAALDRVYAEVTKDITATPEEIEENYNTYLESQKLEYKEYKVRYLHLNDKAKAEEALARVAAGENITELEAEFSLDYVADAENTDPIDIKTTSIPKEVQMMIVEMPVGMATDILESGETDFYIIELFDIVEPDYDTLKTTQEEAFIKTKKDEAFQAEYDKWREEANFKKNEKAYEATRVLGVK